MIRCMNACNFREKVDRKPSLVMCERLTLAVQTVYVTIIHIICGAYRNCTIVLHIKTVIHIKHGLGDQYSHTVLVGKTGSVNAILQI